MIKMKDDIKNNCEEVELVTSGKIKALPILYLLVQNQQWKKEQSAKSFQS